MKIKIYVVLLCLNFISLDALAKNCQEVRLGLDIGSGSTKMMVAKVDYCKKKILEVLLTDTKPIQYNEDLEKHSDGKLSESIINTGLNSMKDLLKKASSFKPKKSYGVATSVFRKSKNGADVIKLFSKTLKIKLEIISQEEEAKLGYLSALSQIDDTDLNSKNVTVWDIGGGSMQMWSEPKGELPQKYLGQLASVTFKTMLIEVLQGKNIETTNSPNPIGPLREQALALARSYAKLHVPADLKSTLKNGLILGIGSVHSISIKNQLHLKELKYNLEALSEASKTQVLKTDSDLTGDYKSTDVTNLLLVQGFMEGLGINEVRIVNASLLQGVVLKNE